MVVAAGVWFSERRGDEFGGFVRIIDGDSLRLGETEIRLAGMDALEHRQTCWRGDREWACGAAATRAMREAIGGRSVTCQTQGTDRYNRTLAVCRVGDLDLGAHMVRIGYAVAYGAYEAEEREAREAGRGMWSGQFDDPATWRSRNPRPRS